MNHLRQGHFYGYYNSTADGGSPSLFSDQPMTPPAVWFPQNEVANSPSQPLSIPEGPFAGDLLVGDITLGGINRVSLEKVHGIWQGCIYRFTQGLEGGVNRLAWGPNGTLYVGCIGGSGNWSWNGTTTGLQRLTPKTGSPATFEIARVSATSTGFEITCTKPVPETTLEDPAAYLLKQWYYQPTADYGGEKLGEETLAVTSATASADRTRVSIVVPGLKAGRVVYLKSDPVSDDASAVLSSEVWYTLNSIPGGPNSVNLDHTSIPENQPGGTAVGHLSASHDRAGEIFTFSLPSGLADNNRFSIDGNLLVAARPFDHERRDSYTVVVRATDQSGLSLDVSFSIQVTDVLAEQAPKRIVLTNATLPPDHVPGALIGKLLIDDDDSGDLQGDSAAIEETGAIARESFDYVAATTLGGQAGGTGFSAAWETIDTNSGVGAASLSYTDSLGFGLKASGNASSCALTSRNSRVLSSSRGTDGTTTYTSFIADPGSNLHFWGIEFWNGTAVDANRVLQLGNEGGFGVRVRNGANRFFSPSDSNSHFFVVKVEHLVGNDRVSAWRDPDLSTEPATPDLLFTPAETGGSIQFTRIGFSNYVTAAAPAVDEFRLGNSWAAVTPHHATFPRLELVSGTGDSDNASFILQGNLLVATAVLSSGLHTIRVRATDSGGHSFEQPILVWVGAGHLDSNHDGISDATAVRLGNDPTAAAEAGAYFGQSGAGTLMQPAGGSGDFLLTSGAVPGNLYWIERSPDLVHWTLESNSMALAEDFLSRWNQWQVSRPNEAKHFWRVGGGWPSSHGTDPLANGLAGLSFIGGSAGWSYDSNTGILRQDHSEPSEWLHFGATYSDFLLSLEYRLSGNGNGGVFLRSTPEGLPWVTGSEIQLTSEPRLPVHSTGAVYDRLPAAPAADSRDSVWHRLEVLMIGDRLRVTVDGITTVDETDVRAAFPGFNWPESGVIGLQDAHSTGSGYVEYRNIRILPLIAYPGN